MARVIQSPGVEIKEHDLSENASTAIGTYIFTTGFADKGPTDEILQITSKEEFEQIYGLPTTPAERYFYHSVTQQFNSPANVLVSRLPYGIENGEGFCIEPTYSVLAYPVNAYNTTVSTINCSIATKTSVLTGNDVGNITDVETLYTKISSNTCIDKSTLTITATSNIKIDYTYDETVACAAASAIANKNAAITHILEKSFTSKPTAENTATSAITGDITDIEYVDIKSINFNNDTIGNAKDGYKATWSYKQSAEKLFTKYITDLEGSNEITTRKIYPPTLIDETTKTYKFWYGYKSSPSTEFDKSNEFIITRPKHFELTEQEYLDLQDGVKWSNNTAFNDALSTIGNAGIIIVNKSQTTINDQYEGYYVGIADNIACEPSSKYQSIMSVQSVASPNAELYTQLPSTRMNFTLSANGGDVSGSSISQIMEDSSSFDIFGSEFDDTLIFNIFKLRKSLYADSTIKLDANLSESYVASVDFYRQMQSQNGGSPVSFFIEKKSEDSSDVQILVNPYLSGKKSGKTWLGDDGKPTKKIRVAFGETNTEFTSGDFDEKYAARYGLTYGTVSALKANAADALYALGVYQEANGNTKILGSVPNKVSRALSKISNIDLFDLDITCEAGLGTIWAYYKEAQAQYLKDHENAKQDEVAKACEFDDESTTVYESASAGNWFKTGQDTFDGNGGKDNGLCENYKTIYNLFANFASNERKDHIFIADPLRFIFLQGSNKKTLSDKSKNFSQHIYWPLRYNFFTANTSYAAAYANWGKVYDTASDGNVWIPMSGILATTYANTDSNYYCWYAPAGPDRGILTTIIDLALSPKQKERDQLYKISLNPIYQDPNMGYVVFGQKTLQSKPSSFDRINVRRLFLYLEKSTYKTIKWFLFRNNTYSTRMAIVNTLDPIFRSCQQNEGVIDYRLVCSETNNTPDVVDANELVVDAYIKASRTAEFIICNFYSTKTGTNFDELIK